MTSRGTKTEPVSTVRAAVYARISQDTHETGLGVERQLKDCRLLAKRKGWTVVEEFVDNDVSATKGKPRPAYEALMGQFRAGVLDALIVWDVDRLTRTPRELEDVVELAERRGLQLASVGGEIDLATPQGRLTARIKGSVARHETEQLSRRVKAKQAELAEKGQSVGKIAYGWQRERAHDSQGRDIGYRDVLHPAQALVLRDAAASVLAGDSLGSIVRTLNDRGVPTVHGGPWTLTIIRSLLLRERNACRRVHQGKVVGVGDWDRLFDDDTHARLVSILRDPARRTSHSSAIKYLLSGLARCGVCDGPIRVLPDRGRTSISYICKNGAHVRRDMAKVDALVSQVVVARLAQPDALDLFQDSSGTDTEAMREQMASLRAKLDLVADQYAEDLIDAQQFTRISSKLRPQLAALEAQLRSASTAPDLHDLATPDIAERWAELPLARKRQVIDLLIEVKVDRVARRSGRGEFDPDAVRITWRSPAVADSGPVGSESGRGIVLAAPLPVSQARLRTSGGWQCCTECSGG